jgi:hypothetical protein
MPKEAFSLLAELVKLAAALDAMLSRYAWTATSLPASMVIWISDRPL